MLISPQKFIRASLNVILFALIIWMIGCSSSTDDSNVNSNASNQNAVAGNANSVKDDVEGLETVVRMPETPEEAVWREEEVAQPKGKKLTAVLKYSSEAAAKVVAATDKNKAPAPTEIDSETWFPDELTAQSQLSGDESIKGTAYAANDFYNGAYNNGKLARVNDTDYFVLELTTY